MRYDELPPAVDFFMRGFFLALGVSAALGLIQAARSLIAWVTA